MNFIFSEGKVLLLNKILKILVTTEKLELVKGNPKNYDLYVNL